MYHNEVKRKMHSLYTFQIPSNISGFKRSWTEKRSCYAFVITSKITLCQSQSKCKRNLTGMCLRQFSRPSQKPSGTTLKAVLSRGYTPANSLLIKVTMLQIGCTYLPYSKSETTYLFNILKPVSRSKPHFFPE